MVCMVGSWIIRMNKAKTTTTKQIKCILLYHFEVALDYFVFSLLYFPKSSIFCQHRTRKKELPANIQIQRPTCHMLARCWCEGTTQRVDDPWWWLWWKDLLSFASFILPFALQQACLSTPPPFTLPHFHHTNVTLSPVLSWPLLCESPGVK